MMLLILHTLATAAILICGLYFALNRMTQKTMHGMRLAWVLMTTGALGALVAPLLGTWHPTTWETALTVGFALYLLSERRSGCIIRRGS